MFVAVADEQASSLAGFSQILRRLPDVEPMCFPQASEALHWLNGAAPVFIVVSATLAQIDGLEFIKRLRLMPGRDELPVIFTSSNASRDQRRAAFELGVYAYLEKPINPNEFLVHATRIVRDFNERIELLHRLAEADRRAAPTAGASISNEDTVVIKAMNQIAVMHDPSIVAHHALSAALARTIGTELRLTGDEVATLGAAAEVYDIGKVAIPQHLIASRSTLIASDRYDIEAHAEAGAKLLATRHTAVMRAAASIALTHHERYDGAGYPHKLRGTGIPIFGRIVAVSDTLASLVRARNDRAALSLAAALDSISQQSGFAFDPIVVGAVRSGLAEISRIMHDAQRLASDAL
ncbi:MAG: response regulator [Vulcanimicrobiaceae bacterium]